MSPVFIFLGGVIFGSILANVMRFEFTSFGTLEVDHKRGLVTAKLTSDDFKTRKKKRIVLKINHDADISQK